MSEYREGAIILTLVEALNRRNSFCGETHLQKGAYILKELLGVDLESSFQLYLYGPYSFDLHRLLESMRTDELLEITPRSTGASWLPGDRSGLLKEKFPRTIKGVKARVEFVAERIARLGVVELGGIATALLVKKEAPDANSEQRITRLREIKPQLSLADAQSAFKVVEEWEAAAPF
jgi:hypothetical protein